jgi:hypothetical protein
MEPSPYGEEPEPQKVPEHLRIAALSIVDRVSRAEEINKDAKLLNLYLWGSRSVFSFIFLHFLPLVPHESLPKALLLSDFTRGYNFPGSNNFSSPSPPSSRFLGLFACSLSVPWPLNAFPFAAMTNG